MFEEILTMEPEEIIPEFSIIATLDIQNIPEFIVIRDFDNLNLRRLFQNFQLLQLWISRLFPEFSFVACSKYFLFKGIFWIEALKFPFK